MKNEPLIWSVFLPRCCALNISDPGGADSGNKLLSLGKQNNYRQVQKLSILSVCNYPECFRATETNILANQKLGWGRSDQSAAPGLSPLAGLVAELAPFVRKIFCIWDQYYYEMLGASAVWQEGDAGCCDLDHRQSLWPLILSFVVTHFISLMIPDLLLAYYNPRVLTFLCSGFVCPEIIKLLLNCKKVDYHTILSPDDGQKATTRFTK